MISKKMQDAINGQVQAELSSAYMYLSMSAYCDSKNFRGFLKWLRAQYLEETAHAMKLLDYLMERGGIVSLAVIDAPPAEYGTPLEVFEKVLEHELYVTSLIHKLHAVAVAESDLAAQIFLQWFVTEQVEEEANATDIVERLKMIGDKSSGILYLDKELGKRGA